MGKLFSQSRDQRKSIHFRHYNVAENDVGMLLLSVFEGGLAVIKDAHHKARSLQDESERVGNSSFIIDYKNMFFTRGSRAHSSHCSKQAHLKIVNNCDEFDRVETALAQVDIIGVASPELNDRQDRILQFVVRCRDCIRALAGLRPWAARLQS